MKCFEQDEAARQERGVREGVGLGCEAGERGQRSMRARASKRESERAIERAIESESESESERSRVSEEGGRLGQWPVDCNACEIMNGCSIIR